MNPETVAKMCVLQARLNFRNARDIAELRVFVDYLVLVPEEYEVCDVMGAT